MRQFITMLIDDLLSLLSSDIKDAVQFVNGQYSANQKKELIRVLKELVTKLEK